MIIPMRLTYLRAPGLDERFPTKPHWPMLESPRSLYASLVSNTALACERCCSVDTGYRVLVGGLWLCPECSERSLASVAL